MSLFENGLIVSRTFSFCHFDRAKIGAKSVKPPYCRFVFFTFNSRKRPVSGYLPRRTAFLHSFNGAYSTAVISCIVVSYSSFDTMLYHTIYYIWYSCDAISNPDVCFLCFVTQNYRPWC